MFYFTNIKNEPFVTKFLYFFFFPSIPSFLFLQKKRIPSFFNNFYFVE